MTTTETVRPAGRPARPAARLAARVVPVVRFLLGLHVLLVLVQPVLAGGYLGGDYDLLSLHALNADLVSYTGYGSLLLVLGLALLGGARWPLAAGAALVGAETVQYLAGMSGSLALHVPLGVALVVGSIALVAALLATPARSLAARS